MPRARARHTPPRLTGADRILEAPSSSLVDLVDRLFDLGVVATGDLTLGVANVDLVYVRLSALLCAADSVLPAAARARRRRRRQPR